jgi:hypothetical protein
MNQSRATRRFCDRHTAERSLKRFRSSDTSEKIAILNKTGILNMQDGRDDEAERCIAQALGHADDKLSGLDISTSSESLYLGSTPKCSRSVIKETNWSTNSPEECPPD